MSITSFLFGNTPTLVKIADTLTVDAAVRVITHRAAVPTKNPVESGSDITDHMKLENLKLSVEGVISETPLSTLLSLIGGFGGGLAGEALQGVQVGGALGGFATTAAVAGASFAAGSAAGALEGLITGR